MSDSLSAHYSLVRDMLEGTCGHYKIGDLGDRGEQSRYIGIHMDERDGMFKQWFVTPAPVNIVNSNFPCSTSSLQLSFESAVNFLQSINNPESSLPPLELPSAQQIHFMVEKLPALFTLSCGSCCQDDVPVPAHLTTKTIAYIFDQSASINFLTRDNSAVNEYGYVLPVYSQPVPEFTPQPIPQPTQ